VKESTAKLLEELGFVSGLHGKLQVKVLQDNKSAIMIAEQGEGYTTKSKHFFVRFNFLKDLIDLGTLFIEYCPTEDMVADFLTKSLPAEPLFHLLAKAFGVDHQRNV
jgi:hypothetical protein